MAEVQPIPQYAQPFIGNEAELARLDLKFNPQWLKWFIDMLEGFASGEAIDHNGLNNLQGGSGTEFYHLSNAQASLITAAQVANRVFAGPAAGANAAPTFRALVAADLPITLGSGVNTPTLTNTLNVAASTPHPEIYLRVGNVVTVSGQLDMTPTLAATVTNIGLSLPIASNLADQWDLGGTGVSITAASDAWSLYADAANNRVLMQGSPAAGAQAVTYHYTYEVI